MVEGSSYCYKVVENDVTWQPAFDYCQAEGAYLAHIKNEDENKKLIDYFQQEVKIAKEALWLGFNKTGDNEWSWQPHGEELVYAPWYTNQPNNNNNEDCGTAYTKERGTKFEGKWNDIKCDDALLSFVCMKMKNF